VINIDMSGMTVTKEADENRLLDRLSERLYKQTQRSAAGVY